MNDSEKVFFLIFIPSFVFLIWGLLAVGIQGEYNSKNSALPLGVILAFVSLIIKAWMDRKEKK